MIPTVTEVLLVEDSPTDALLLSESLAGDALTIFLVTVVERLRDALHLLAQRTFDVVLLDLGLPDSDGLATFEALHRAAPDLPVVVFSGNLDTRAAVAAVQQGAQDYLVKGQAAWDVAPRAIRYAIERQHSQSMLLTLNHTLESRVAQRTAEMQDLYDNAPCGYHSLNADGIYVRVNDTELEWLGRSREEVIGRPFTDFVDERGREQFRLRYPELVRAGEVKDIEFDYVRPDGTSMPVLLKATAVYDKDGNFVMSRSISVDVLERRHVADALYVANIELARALRVKDEFLANMSHELRTPLNNILMVVDILAEQLAGPLSEQQRRHIATIDMSGRHLLDLINDILDLSKIEVDRMALDLEDIAVDELCRTCILFVRELAVRKRIELHYAGLRQAPAMRADPRRLKQILINLLTNAVKFTPDGGRVSLEVQALSDGKYIEFSVQDNGIGIARADTGRLFQPFSQLDTDTDRRQEGTGLGLALVSRLVKLHGGEVSVESDGIEGKGSRFKVILPLHTASANGGASVPAPSSAVRTRAS